MMDERMETLRLCLRHFTPADTDELHHIYSYPDLFKYMSNEKPIFREQTQALIHSLTDNWRYHKFGVWAIVSKQNQKLIGHCGFKFLEKTGEIQIGYLLHPHYWGRGLATEAATAALRYGFEVANFGRIVAIAKPENWASRCIMEKLGMDYKKDAYYYNTNVVYYSLSREEYQFKGIPLKRKSQKTLPTDLLLTC